MQRKGPTEHRASGVVKCIVAKAYARYGVGEYWIVDPVAQVVEVYRLAAEGFHVAATCAKGNTVETPLLPGFSLAVGLIFKP